MRITQFKHTDSTVLEHSSPVAVPAKIDRIRTRIKAGN